MKRNNVQGRRGGAAFADVAENMVQNPVSTVRGKVMNVVFGILILGLGHSIGSMFRSHMNRKAQRQWQSSQQTAMQLSYVTIGTFIYWSCLSVAFLIMLRLLGVEIAGIIAVIGTLGFAVGLAAQGVLGDMASGISLSFSNAFTIGDVIEVDGRHGVVRDFTLFKTVMEDYDTKAIVIIPNRTIVDGIFVNHTQQPIRLMHFDILVSNANKDFAKIQQVVYAVASQEPKVLTTYPYDVNVVGMDGGGTVIKVKLAIESKNYPWMIPAFMTRLRQALSDSGVQLLDIKIGK